MQKQTKKGVSAIKRFVKWIAIMLVAVNILTCAVLAGLTLALWPYADSKVDRALLDLARFGGTSYLYAYDFTDRAARQGKAYELGALCGGSTYYEFAPYESLPPALIDAFVSIEDKRFWAHQGVDFLRSGEAAVAYLKNRLLGKKGRSFGASTITQQLVKNLTGNDSVSVERKIGEIFSALDLERRLDKREILEAYLNIINLADGCRGVGAAAKHYFSKTPDCLTVGECACIAAITNNPARYNPLTHPAQNEQRRQLILSCMLEQGYLDAEAYAKAAAPITLVPDGRKGNPTASWYEDMVVSDVIRDLCATYGYSRAVASAMVYGGGLRIYAAMDPEVQGVLEHYYATTNIFAPDERSAMIVIDPATGDVLGVAGANGPKQGNRVQNYATDVRLPPGSAIKPLSVFAPALERGLIHWASVYDDVPVSFEQGKPWPRNAHYAYHGLTTVERALAESVNTVAVKILDEVGVHNSWNFLYHQLEMASLEQSDLTRAGLALGQLSHGISVRELTAGYTVFFSGEFCHPRTYFHVTDANGVVLLSDTLAPREVLRRENAAIMTQMLRGVITSGTAKGKVTLAERTEVAGKTGTTQRGVDRWFVGYTPAVLGGVWTGYDYPAEREGIASNVSITVWDEVMSLLYQKGLFDGADNEFDLPDSLIRLSYCADSGQIPTDACHADLRGTRSRSGYFTEDNCPGHECQTHELVDYDTVFGGVANELCPHEVRRAVGFLHRERDFPDQVYVRDAPYFLWDEPPLPGRFRGEWYATPSKTLPCPAHTEGESEESTQTESQDQ